MRASDIINQLRSVLPKYSTKFSTIKSVVSLSSVGTLVTANVVAHGLETGEFSRIIGAKIPYSVDSLTRVGEQATCITDNENDVTFFNRDDIIQEIEIVGANETDYNGTKTLIEPQILNISSLTKVGNTITAITTEDHGFVVNSNFKIKIWNASQGLYNQEEIEVASIINSKTFTYTVIGETISPATTSSIIQCQAIQNKYTFFFEVENSPNTPATGTIYQLLIKNAGYNGFKEITKVDVNNFTYILDNALNSPAQGTITCDVARRIDGGMDISVLKKAYTKQVTDNYNMYLVMDDTLPSKERSELTDIVYVYKNGATYRQNVYQGFNLYVFIPTKTELTAINLQDDIYDLRRAVFKSILGVEFSSALDEEGTNKFNGVVYNGDGFEDYVDAYYIHRFSFQVSGEILNEDIVNEDDSSAFNEIVETYKNEDDSIGSVIGNPLLRD